MKCDIGVGNTRVSQPRATRLFKTRSPEETYLLGLNLGRLLSRPAVIGLSGPLGAGKTLFARGIARGLGVEDYVKSPSFTFVHEHRGRLPMYLVDVYRLNDPSEAEDIGLCEILEEEAVVVIEWADKVSALMPQERIDVAMKWDAGDESSRDIVLTGHGYAFAGIVERVGRGDEPS
jgi:tRNA threonylcarbamoyladenosine biosynthesis protein TsaE